MSMSPRILYAMTVKNRSLTAEDWLIQGFIVLSEGGYSAIKAEAIARKLNVSKGSFYWHFQNVPAYKNAMLAYWLENGTQRIIDQTENDSQSPHDKLMLLVALSTQPSTYPFDENLAEASIRDWARHEKEAADVLYRVDQKRLDYLAALFINAGFSANRSKQCARLVYGCLIGIPQLPDDSPKRQQTDLKRLLDCLLSTPAM